MEKGMAQLVRPLIVSSVVVAMFALHNSIIISATEDSFFYHIYC